MHFKEKWRTAQRFYKIIGQVSEDCGTKQEGNMCTKLTLVRNICIKELVSEENKCVGVRGKY